MQQRKRKNGCFKVDGRKYYEKISGIACTYALIIFLSSCSTINLKESGKKFPLCQLGEGSLVSTTNKGKQSFPFSMKLDHHSLLIGLDLPLRGEVVLKVNEDGADLSPFVRYLDSGALRSASKISRELGRFYLSLRDSSYFAMQNESFNFDGTDFFVQSGEKRGDFRILGVRRWWIFNLGKVSFEFKFSDCEKI